MTEVYVAGDNIITPLGFNTVENIDNLTNNITGIKPWNLEEFSPAPFCASLIDSVKLNTYFINEFQNPGKYTRLEKMFILSISDALKKTKVDIKSKKTLLIISTTKGNIDLLESKNKSDFDSNRLYLSAMAKIVQQFFHNPNTPVVISSACISGVLSIIAAARLLQSSQYENIIVSGGDIISSFTVSGFQSFKALSLKPCKPFDASRDGLNLGEGCGTIILTSTPEKEAGDEIVVSGGASSNDANHISGPSRTGDGLFISIKNAIAEAELNSSKDIEYISAHGTATPYNDEMESKAFMLAGLGHVPVNSFKGFFGHTLGAAGIIESIAGIHSLKENILFNTLGFEQIGVSENINIISKSEKTNIKNCLKTASGFGGSNGAVLFSKK